MQYNCLTNGDTIRDFILSSQMNESASLLLMEYPVNVWKQSETKHNELLHVNGVACVARNAQCCVTWRHSVCVARIVRRNAQWRCRRESSSCKTFWWFPCRECWSITFYSRQAHAAHGQISTLQLSSSTHSYRKTVLLCHVALCFHPWEATRACSCSENSPRNNVNNTVFIQEEEKVISHVPATLASFPVIIIALY